MARIAVSWLKRLVEYGGLLCLGWALVIPSELAAEPERIGVIDLHVDLPYRSLYKAKPFATGSGQFMAKQLLQAGVRGVVLPLYLPEDASPQGRTRAELERSYAHVFRSILATPPYALFGCGVGRAGNDARGIETWLAFEGSAPVGADLFEIRKWALRGVRSFGLVHSEANSLASSSGQTEPVTFGLTAEGRSFSEYVFQVGGLLDVSHSSDRATDEALDLASERGGIVIATHSNARRLAPHPRNLSDEQIVRIGKMGGVIGVNLHQRFLSPDGGPQAGMKDVVRQIKYLLRLAGPSAVALGSDFEGGIRPVSEMPSVSEFQKLATALVDAGLTPAQVQKVFFQNARRVLCPPNH